MTSEEILIQAKLLINEIDQSVDEFIAARQLNISPETQELHELRHQIANVKLRVILKRGNGDEK